MRNEVIALDMRHPKAGEVITKWAHIDPVERAKWAKKPDTRTIAEVDAEMTAALSAYRR